MLQYCEVGFWWKEREVGRTKSWTSGRGWFLCVFVVVGRWADVVGVSYTLRKTRREAVAIREANLGYPKPTKKAQNKRARGVCLSDTCAHVIYTI